jgi:UDP-2,3-diacylglucosamine hydrolase
MTASLSPAQGLVLSDLHLFTPRSDGVVRFESLHSRLNQMQVLILNGDTFDFRWSEFPDHETTTKAALDWLKALLRNLPKCSIHFVLGNHDCLSTFTQHLPSLANDYPTFHWHDRWLQLGTTIFLHGDCAHRRMDLAGLDRYRAVWQEDEQRSRLASKAYACADGLGLTNLAHRWTFPRRRTLNRIVHYLDRACPSWRRVTRHCYFGHTHIPFSGEVFGGIRFHNTGAALRGVAFKPLTFDLHDPGP